MTGPVARRVRILFLITQFDTGGVQFQLYLRLRHLDPQRFDARVLVLTGGTSYLLDKVKALGVPVDVLHLDDCSLAGKVLRIRKAIAAVGPDIVDAMLGWDITYGNAAATLANVTLHRRGDSERAKSSNRRNQPRLSPPPGSCVAVLLRHDRVLLASGARQLPSRDALAGLADDGHPRRDRRRRPPADDA